MSYVLKHKHYIYIFFFSIRNIESNYYIIFLNFTPIIFFWWKIYSFPLIFICKRFNFCYSFRIFSWFSSWLNATVTAYWKHLLFFYGWDLLLLFCFLSNQENLYMIHYKCDLFYGYHDTINEPNSLPFIDSKLFWYLFLSESKRFFITSYASSLIMIPVFLLFECITRLSSIFMEEIKLFVIVNWIFHVSDFLRWCFDSVLFLSPSFSYPI